MSDVEVEAPRRGRRSNAEIAAEARDRKLESMPPTLPEDIRKRAARQAHVSAEALKAREPVEVKVTKKGDARISMGIHVQGIGDAKFERGETFPIAPQIAAELESQGLVRYPGKDYDDD